MSHYPVVKSYRMYPSRGRIVFSERAALSGQGSRTSLLKQLQPGNCVEGIVTNVTDFGVFVDLGGVEGTDSCFRAFLG
jgi:small subunit ribosomal protein S1